MNVQGITRAGTGIVEDTQAPTGPSGTPSDLPPIDLGADGVDPTPRRARAAEQVGPTESPARACPDRPSSAEAQAAARAFVSGGWAALDAWMDRSPAEMRALLCQPRGQIEAEIRTALERTYGGHLGAVRAWWDADVIVDRIAERASPMLREAVRREAVARIDAQLEQLGTRSPAELLQSMRSAPPGSPAARLAAAIGLTGDDADLARVADYRSQALAQLRELRGAIMGQAWSPDELPGSRQAVIQRMHLDCAAEGSIAAAALDRQPGAAETAEQVTEAVDNALTLVEIAEGLHAVAAVAAAGEGVAVVAVEALAVVAPPVALALAGLAFGMALHHAIEDNRRERREVARHLGI